MRVIGAALCGGALALAGCGEDRQDADEPEGTFPVAVSAPQFPTAQVLAQQSTFELTVRNAGQQTIPNLAVTLRGFARRTDGADEGAGTDGDGGRSGAERLSDPERPVWVIDDEPEGGVTAYDDTWTAGELAPGRTATLRWRVTPVIAGRHELRYTVSAGLDGKAKAVTAAGAPTTGELTVTVSDEPAAARVNPETGGVVRVEPGEED